MRLSKDWLHKWWLVAAAGLIMVALSACTAGHRAAQGDRAVTGFTSAVDGVTDTSKQAAAGNAGLLRGRAKYEGSASGEYSSRGLTDVVGYFRATVSLIADFADNSIGGVVSDGRDTATDEELFSDLRLAPATIAAGDGASFQNSATGVINGDLFNGTWSGRFTGEGTSSAASRSSVGGMFQAQRSDAPGESLTGTFNGDYHGHPDGTVGALNDVSLTMRSRLGSSIATAALREALSTADVADAMGSTVWNAGVTQSSDNPRPPEDPDVANWAVNARYDGDDLVFDRTNLLDSSPVTVTTGGEHEAPGFRTAIASMWPGWKGVEHLHIDADRIWNYSILVSDIEDNEDTDYMAGGFWASLPNLDNPADVRLPSFMAAAGGSDPFQGGNIELLKGHAGYEGRAVGLYAALRDTPAIRQFGARVRLTADFSHNRVYGVVVDGRDAATDEPLFAGLELGGAAVRTDGNASFEGYVNGVLNGSLASGRWGGQFLGNGASSIDVPESVAGTFGARSYYGYENLVGIFGAYEDLTRLLSGHGLAAGDVTVAPGESEAHGNLVMSCPADGSACSITVRPDGTAFHDRNGGDPGFVFKLPDAPTVALDGGLHVGADVAPAGQLAAAGTRHGVSVSTGRVRDGVGARQVVRYLREHVSDNRPGLDAFAVRPVVRVAEGTGDELVEFTERAVQLINAALPYDKRVLFSSEPAPSLTVIQDVPDGEIFVDFTPWSDWNPDRNVGSSWWQRRSSNRSNDEAQRRETLERRASHIWIDSERMRTAWVRDPVTRRWEEVVLESRVDDTDTLVKWRSDDYIVRIVASMLLRGIGFGGRVDATAFPDTILNFTDVRTRTVELSNGATVRLNERVYLPGHILYPIDREALLAAYGRLQPGTLPEDLSAEGLGPWSDTSFHLRGSLDSGGGQVSFGVASRNGLAQPWASGRAPSRNLTDNAALSGTVTWNGALLGMTRSGETVAGAASLAVDLATLDGQLDLTSLEQWSAGSAPGTAGTGTAWGDGDLGYSISVDGNGFTETGGDHGEVTGVFVGTSHQGMGGVIERNDLAAAFGGKR